MQFHFNVLVLAFGYSGTRVNLGWQCGDGALWCRVQLSAVRHRYDFQVRDEVSPHEDNISNYGHTRGPIYALCIVLNMQT